MAEKPRTRAGYPAELAGLAHDTCLYVATILGDLIEHITVVGGLVPSLLVTPGGQDGSVEAHVGTLDLDLGLSIAVFDGSRYQEIAERLRGAGFTQASNAKGRLSRQTWGIETPQGRIRMPMICSTSSSTSDEGRRTSSNGSGRFCRTSIASRHSRSCARISWPWMGSAPCGSRTFSRAHPTMTSRRKWSAS